MEISYARSTIDGSYYCSTSGTTFSDKQSYMDHMKSDYHKYNLKRKVAGLPPVTKEWFETRKAQLASGSIAVNVAKVWIDPLTKKKFSNQNTYLAHIKSKKYQDLVKKSGQPPPGPIIVNKHSEADHSRTTEHDMSHGQPTRSFATTFSSMKPACSELQENEALEESDDESGWETASTSDEDVLEATHEHQNDEGETHWDDWDVCKSLFDNHCSPSMDLNLEYMYRKFGFYFPDAEYLQDPEGLLKYLGAKLQYGRVPLYSRGDDENAKHFKSLHAVQRHMVDLNQCRMAYEDNEEEYSQFYDYGDVLESVAGNEHDYVISNSVEPAQVLGTSELLLPGAGKNSCIVLGAREFARYYKQRLRPGDERLSVTVNTMHSRYRSLGITLIEGKKTLGEKIKCAKSSKDLKWEGKREVKRLEFSNFLKKLGKGIGREF
ncbi:hypothetical protein CEUSTIGMA_g6920.t1 [Chlamydomonas eustigma]|uniref:ZN622/Rei1/Reh1 zinc finger C2H2-type domain-containing protein n=1 Tax=Chlamydomonas eustigma TaxID=1157962 RepID=A0A250X995_9CHLO|nr:hypothetical protein CEUSTIGMA_g6920.t1 [Chlamydomonas eustigma]|eukprot:GAX79479.1 hypothetical protein CEUSTIGMA_g6920.t1 [Chlamydomonas eustigma]